MSFLDKLLKASRANGTLLCIGLDPDPALLPQTDVLAFNKAIIDATQDLVCAYKPNLAFYEALGIEGLRVLDATRRYIPERIPVIADAKRGDIGNTSKWYAKALFETFGFDAATVNPYLGYDALEPFLDYARAGVFILCKTSNPGAQDFQDLRIANSQDARLLFEEVARKSSGWNRHGNIGLVMGATYPEPLRIVRRICPDMPLLIPGVGPQGGDLAQAVHHAVDEHGERAIIASSRQVLYASKGKDFASAARRVAEGLREEMNRHRYGTGASRGG